MNMQIYYKYILFIFILLTGFFTVNAQKSKTLIVGQWEPFNQKVFSPDLIWKNAKEKINSKDDDGNGIADDINGILIQNDGKAVSFPFMASKDSIDFYDHGTAVASVMLKDLKNVQMAGVAFVPTSQRLKEMGLLSLSTEERLKQLPTEFSLLDDYAMKAVQYFKSIHAGIVNMSWGTHFERMNEVNRNLGNTKKEREENVKRWLDAFTNAYKKAIETAPEILFIVAAGNNGADVDEDFDTPAKLHLDNMIVVGALGKNGQIADWSNKGKKVDIYAVGEGVSFTNAGGSTETDDGTSLAAPQVTNMAIQLAQQHKGIKPITLKKLLIEKLAKPVYKNKFLVSQ